MDPRSASLIDLLDHYAATTPDAPFLQLMDHEPLSFAAVHERTRHLAAGLQDNGVGEDDSVLIMLPNGLEIVESWLACNALGARQVPVNVFLRGEFLRHVVEDSSARVMIIDAAFVPALNDIDVSDRLKHVFVLGTMDLPDLPGVDVHAYETLRSSAAIKTLHPAAFGDVSGIYYTSGTTGPAKGILFTYGQGTITARNYVDATGADEGDVFYCCMPLFHSNAQILQVQVPLMLGARVSIWPQFSAGQWLNQVRSVGATITNMLGVMTEFVFAQEPGSSDADNPLRVVQAIPAPAGIVADFEERFAVSCIDGYGLTDVGMVAFRRHDQELVPGSSGFPVDDYDVMIADPQTDEPVALGETGEIMLRPNVPGAFMRGYWKRPELTIASWRNLWFHTGDLGRLDADGRLYFEDRMGDSIRVRGENISSAQVESVIAAHDQIEQCAAVAVPSDVGDYEVLLVAVRRPGSRLSAEELVDHCEGRMPYFAIPRYVEFVDALPMTPTQKIQKYELRRRGVGPQVWDRRRESLESAR